MRGFIVFFAPALALDPIEMRARSGLKLRHRSEVWLREHFLGDGFTIPIWCGV
jgi:hypothetical protein